MERSNVWSSYNDDQLTELEHISALYKKCLDEGKTERECVKIAVRMAEEKGYRDLKELIRTGSQIKTGDKVYAICMNKSISLFNIGKKPLEEGMNILGAHIDSPRMDVKQNPLYESDEFAYLDTHYYGGIKKYQWVTLPLAIHGVVAKTNGETVDVCIGEKDDEPVFAVTDLLIHLAGRQMEKKASIVIEGEKLDLLIGSRPLSENPDDDEENKETRDAVKKNILRLLEEYCGMTEEDFASAELEIVPAGRARDMGLDRSMVMGYGQDDRVCSFTSLFAMLDMDSVDKTSCCILVDKEEIGSVGATGMHSRFFENTVAEILALMGETSDLKVRRTLQNSRMLSSDVSAAYDPMFAEVFEREAPRSLQKAWYSTSSPEAAARADRTTPMQNTSQRSERRSMTRKSPTSSQSSAKSTSAAAERSHTSWPTTAWKSSTAAWQSSACTRRGRSPARPTFTKHTRAIRHFSRTCRSLCKACSASLSRRSAVRRTLRVLFCYETSSTACALRYYLLRAEGKQLTAASLL